VEGLEARIPCTRRLRRGESLVLFFPIDLGVFCCAGHVSIALEDGAGPVLLAAGERYAAQHNARLTLTFREGAKNEWLADMGFAVIAFLPAPDE
jgi:hypothetical protein